MEVEAQHLPRNGWPTSREQADFELWPEVTPQTAVDVTEARTVPGKMLKSVSSDGARGRHVAGCAASESGFHLFPNHPCPLG